MGVRSSNWNLLEPSPWFLMGIEGREAGISQWMNYGSGGNREHQSRTLESPYSHTEQCSCYSFWSLKNRWRLERGFFKVGKITREIGGSIVVRRLGKIRFKNYATSIPLGQDFPGLTTCSCLGKRVLAEKSSSHELPRDPMLLRGERIFGIWRMYKEYFI